MRTFGQLTRRRTARVQRIATIVLLLGLVAHEAIAQQPGGQIAYTIGSLDFSEVRLRASDGTDRGLYPDIRVRVPADFGVPGNTVTASVASLGMPVWSKDRRLIVANALLAPKEATGFDQALINDISTPGKILVVFDPQTGQGNAVFDMTPGTQSPVSLYAIDAAFSPDGNRLVYSSLQTNFIQYGIINRDGTGNVPLFATNLTEQALGIGVDWSPRADASGNFGNLLVVSYPLPVNTCIGTPTTAAGLVLVGVGSPMTAQVLTRPPGPCGWDFLSWHDRSPVFSPDGTQIAFVRSAQDSQGIVVGSAIMVINRNGSFGGERYLAYFPGNMIQHLSWSPDSGQPGVVSRVMFDVTQVYFGGLTSSLGIRTVTVPASGAGVVSPVAGFGPQVFAPAWGQ